MTTTAKTGIFYVKDPAGIVMMHKGREVQRYRSAEELIEIHIKGLAALEREMDRTIEAQYKPGFE